MAISILGISWAQIRGKIVKALGPNGELIMQGLEAVFDVVMALLNGGPAAAWEVIKDKLTTLKDTIVQGIISFVTEAVVTKAIPKLIAMFIPGAGFISAIVSIYDVIKTFIEKLTKIGQVIGAFVNSIVAIAAGNIGGAAAKVESVLGGLLSLAISFFAGFVGLGKVSTKVREIVNKIRATVDKAIEAAVTWIISKAKSLFKSLFGGKDKKPDARTDDQKMADLRKAVAESEPIVSDKKSSKRKKQKAILKLKTKYKLTSIELITDTKTKQDETVHVMATINPTYNSSGIIIAAFPPSPVVRIEAIVQAAIPREGMERVLAPRPGLQRAHLVGPGLGYDRPEGVFYATEEVNQRLQRIGIETMIKEMYDRRYPGAEFMLVATATPRAGDMLARANYKLNGRMPGEEWTQLFEYTIVVSASAATPPKVLSGEPPDMSAINRMSQGAQAVMARRGFGP